MIILYIALFLLSFLTGFISAAIVFSKRINNSNKFYAESLQEWREKHDALLEAHLSLYNKFKKCTCGSEIQLTFGTTKIQDII